MRYLHTSGRVGSSCKSVREQLKGVCLLHLLSENIFPVLRSNWFYVLMKQKLIWNLSLCYFSLRSADAQRKPDRTTQGRILPQCKMWAEADNDSVLRCPWHWQAGLWKLDWLRLSIVSLLWFTFLFIVLWNVLGVQPIICHSRFCSGVLKIQRIEELGVWRKR